MISQDSEYDLGGLIPTSQPDHFRRRSIEPCHVCEIRVLRHDGVTVGRRRVSHGSIVGLIKTDSTNVVRAGKQVCKKGAKLETEILVKEQFHHAVVTRRRSRSAA